MAFSAMDQMMLQMMRQMRQGADESAGNLPRLREAFVGDPRVSFDLDGRAIQINFRTISNGAEDIVRPILSQKFPFADKNQIRFYLSLVRPPDAPDFLETLLFAQNGQVRHCVYIEEFGYSDICRFHDLEEVIVEIRRMLDLVCWKPNVLNFFYFIYLFIVIVIDINININIKKILLKILKNI